MSNKKDKLKELKEFIKANPGKSKRFYAEHNGVVSKNTYYSWEKKCLLSASDSEQPDNIDLLKEAGITPTSKTYSSENIFFENDEEKNLKFKEIVTWIKRNPDYVGIEYFKKIDKKYTDIQVKKIKKLIEADVENKKLFAENKKLKSERNEFLNDGEKGDYRVYIHILPNNTIYIGQTKQSLKERWENGRGYSHNSFFTNLIKKYGWDNIDHLLYKDNLTKKEADTIERDLIKFYSSNEHITGRVVLNIVYNQ